MWTDYCAEVLSVRCAHTEWMMQLHLEFNCLKNCVIIFFIEWDLVVAMRVVLCARSFNHFFFSHCVIFFTIFTNSHSLRVCIENVEPFFVFCMSIFALSSNMKTIARTFISSLVALMPTSWTRLFFLLLRCAFDRMWSNTMQCNANAERMNGEAGRKKETNWLAQHTGQSQQTVKYNAAQTNKLNKLISMFAPFVH